MAFPKYGATLKKYHETEAKHHEKIADHHKKQAERASKFVELNETHYPAKKRGRPFKNKDEQDAA